LMRKAAEARSKAAVAQSHFSRDMHLQIAEQFERKAAWLSRSPTTRA
jgi:hypothetical protein